MTSPFLDSLVDRMRRHSGRIAVQSRGVTVTYGELLERAHALRDSLISRGIRGGDRVALIGNKGVADYASILAILLAGAAYVPLNPKAPAGRNAYILEKSGASGILSDIENSRALESLAGRPARFALCSDDGRELPWTPATDRAACIDRFEDGAYIIFTSGTTGRPKGVPITRTNLAAYLKNLESLFEIFPDDRVAHLSDLSFDLSVHEIFLTWFHGAALCCIPQSAALMASRYVEDETISVWVSVPSTISLAAMAGTLAPESMRSVRLAFFCGEALSSATVRSFAAAAPDARIVNLWGPTETTVSFSYFEVDPKQALPEIVPIGKAYADQFLQVADPDGRTLPAGEIGELLAAGSQVSQGYWLSPELNGEKFLLRDGHQWYRTGDLAVWDENFGFCYKGRADRQVKVKGYRIELQDCETAIRECGGWDLVCVVPWPRTESGAALGLAAFICAESVDAASLQDALRRVLPPYMIPEHIAALSGFPFNANGKVDYKALEAEAEQLLRRG